MRLGVMNIPFPRGHAAPTGASGCACACWATLCVFGGGAFVGESGMSVPLLIIAATALVGGPANAARLHIRSSPYHVIWRGLSTSDGRMATQGPRAPDHRVLHIGISGALHFQALCPWRGQWIVPPCAPQTVLCVGKGWVDRGPREPEGFGGATVLSALSNGRAAGSASVWGRQMMTERPPSTGAHIPSGAPAAEGGGGLGTPNAANSKTNRSLTTRRTF